MLQNEFLIKRIDFLNFDVVQLKGLALMIEEYESVLKESDFGTISGWDILGTSNSHLFGVKNIPEDYAPRLEDMIYPTVNCLGYFNQIVSEFTKFGFLLSRARVLKLGPQSGLPFHSDYLQDNQFSKTRIHIPLLTNSDAYFEWDIDGKIIRRHLPADGSAYFVNVSHRHRVVNENPHDSRLHFVSNFYFNNN
jgi:hypothetical protein